MYDVYAILKPLPRRPELPKRIGPLKNVYGLKHAKEQMAIVVYQFLLQHAEQHLRVQLRVTGTLGFTPVR